LEDLRGGEAEENAAALTALMQGAAGAYRDVVLFNAAAALIIAGKAVDLPEGVAMAARAIDEGLALAKLHRLVEITNRTVPGAS